MEGYGCLEWDAQHQNGRFREYAQSLLDSGAGLKLFIWDTDYLTEYWSGDCIVLAHSQDEARTLAIDYLCEHGDSGLEGEEAKIYYRIALAKDSSRVLQYNRPAVIHEAKGRG